MNENKRVIRERKTITIMIKMYCANIHGSKNGALCPECLAIDQYAM